ncbi:diguanylate cyclase [Heliobacterium gestii]|uniref:Diguanylate cyclase n=1 Tax=Heliomicrobium gestii TaxID=2699 RepID=A0A845L4Q7_HELGE|nr:diguanylate cyclase [Heliomicrobium gestii]MBM7865284.1 diguanylate cyclase (GGDEF)-like protein/PAS domain S-box-containing protein [Heliomicrobium gestii]MZP41547.1 diguanylate cyclase [Heliomicrobium gestii]
MDYSLLTKEELVTRLLQAEETLNRLRFRDESECKLKKILHCAPVGICITDEQGVYEDVNPAYCSIYGYEKEELIGRSFAIVCTDDNRESVFAAYGSIISNRSERSDEWEVVRKDGRKIIVYAKTMSICENDGRPKNVTFVIDITARKKYEAELLLNNRLLQRQAVTDSLTGLLNHGAIFNALEVEVIQSSGSRKELCILLLDVDNLININEEYGHIVGDSILMSVSQVVYSTVRKEDIVGRYGGKRLLIIFPDTDLASARSIAENVWRKVQQIAEYEVHVSVSGGLIQRSDETSLDVIRKAEAQLHKAKMSGMNRIVS